MWSHVRGLFVGTLCGVALVATACSSGTRASSAPSPHPPGTGVPGVSSSATIRGPGAPAGQAGAYCQNFQLMEVDLAPQGTLAQMSPPQVQAFFSRLDYYLSRAVSEAPPSLSAATQSLADLYRQLGQEMAAHGYNPSYNPPDEQNLGSVELTFLKAVRPWLSVHCPAVLHPEAPPGSSELPSGGLQGTLPFPSSSGPAGP